MDKSKRRWCYVPMCKNTACSTPYKKFLTVPYNKGERQTWYDVAHREGPMSSGRLWCCEDHFGNLKDILVNHAQVMLGERPKLRAGVLPSKFACQQHKEGNGGLAERGGVLKRKRLLHELPDSGPGETEFSWQRYLEDSDLEAADDSAFSHVRRESVTYSAGSIVELLSEEGDTAWPAHVTMACDSLLRLHYVGSQGSAHDLWCDPAGGRLRPLGWGWQQGVRLVAPPGVLPADLSAEELSELLPPGAGEGKLMAGDTTSRQGGASIERISEGMKLEVLDDANPYHVWTATVLERRGVRLRLRRDTLDVTPDLWLCVGSPRVRHFGWAARAGAPFVYRPPAEYAADRTQAEWEAILEMSRDEARQMAVDDSILPHAEYELPLKHGLSVGCRLEAVHPDRSAICPASVVGLLDQHFFTVQIEGSAVSWLSSLQDPNILPYGWCAEHGLELSRDHGLPSRPASASGEAAEAGPADGALRGSPSREDRQPPPEGSETEELPNSQETVDLIQTVLQTDSQESQDSLGTEGPQGIQRAQQLVQAEFGQESQDSLGTEGLEGNLQAEELVQTEFGQESQDSVKTEGSREVQQADELIQTEELVQTNAGPDNTETNCFLASRISGDFLGSPEMEELPLSQPTAEEAPDSQPRDSLPGSPESTTEPLPDSQKTGPLSDSPDTETLPDSQRTADVPDSQPPVSAVSEWLLEGGSEDGLSSGRGESAGGPWLHLGPVLEEDTMTSQPAGDVSLSELGDDSFCSREGGGIESPAEALGMQLLSAGSEVLPDEENELPDGEELPDEESLPDDEDRLANSEVLQCSGDELAGVEDLPISGDKLPDGVEELPDDELPDDEDVLPEDAELPDDPELSDAERASASSTGGEELSPSELGLSPSDVQPVTEQLSPFSGVQPAESSPAHQFPVQTVEEQTAVSPEVPLIKETPQPQAQPLEERMAPSSSVQRVDESPFPQSEPQTVEERMPSSGVVPDDKSPSSQPIARAMNDQLTPSSEVDPMEVTLSLDPEPEPVDTAMSSPLPEAHTVDGEVVLSAEALAEMETEEGAVCSPPVEVLPPPAVAEGRPQSESSLPLSEVQSSAGTLPPLGNVEERWPEDDVPVSPADVQPSSAELQLSCAEVQTPSTEVQPYAETQPSLAVDKLPAEEEEIRPPSCAQSSTSDSPHQLSGPSPTPETAPPDDRVTSPTSPAPHQLSGPSPTPGTAPPDGRGTSPTSPAPYQLSGPSPTPGTAPPDGRVTSPTSPAPVAGETLSPALQCDGEPPDHNAVDAASAAVTTSPRPAASPGGTRSPAVSPFAPGEFAIDAGTSLTAEVTSAGDEMCSPVGKESCAVDPEAGAVGNESVSGEDIDKASSSGDKVSPFVEELLLADPVISAAAAEHDQKHVNAGEDDGISPCSTNPSVCKESSFADSAAAAAVDEKQPHAEVKYEVHIPCKRESDATEERGEEDAAPRVQSSDLAPQEPAECAGLSPGLALELVHPDSPEQLCAAAVQRTAGHLLWLRLLSAAGCPELIFPSSSDSLFPPGWAAGHGVTLRPPADWPRRPRRRRPRPRAQAPVSAEDDADSCAESESESLSDSERRAASDSSAITWTGPLYVNTACHSGPLLSTNKLTAQPRVVGAGPVRLVARDLLTRLVWAGYNESRVLKLLQCSGPARTGWTNDLIKTKVNNTIYGGVVELPLSREHLAEFCAAVFSRLQCCPALVSPSRYPADSCPHRCRATLRPSQQANRSADPPSADTGPALLRERLGPAKRPRPDYLHTPEPPARRRRARPPKWLEESESKSAVREESESAVPSSGRREPRSPPDGGRPALYQVTLEKNPRLWDSADLARYLGNTECAHLVPGLLKQDLDGVSFMLLTLSTLTEVLELSERDAVALCTHVSRVKYTYFTAFSG